MVARPEKLTQRVALDPGRGGAARHGDSKGTETDGQRAPRTRLAEAEDRNAEERHADHLIAQLTKLDAESNEFQSQFTALKKAVTENAETEEADEFPIVEKARSEAQRIELGERVKSCRPVPAS